MLSLADVPASRDDFEVVGVFNPGAVAYRDGVMILARVAERPREKRDNFTGLPRWRSGKGLEVDWVPNSELESLDPRVVRLRGSGSIRLTFASHIRAIFSPDGIKAEPTNSQASFKSLFLPENEYEEFGVEDPRLTPLEGRYYFTYVSVSRHGAATALASTKDFIVFERHGIIFPPENKDVLLFPEKIGEEYIALHRPNPATLFSQPEMWLARSRDLVCWGGHRQVYAGGAPWESGRTGGGVPPIKIPEGWLEIYHGNRSVTRPGEIGSYAAGVMLLDLRDPGRVRAVSREPIMVPTEAFEASGFVPGVVFPTGAVEKDGSLLVYYGAADAACGVTGFSLTDLLAAF